MSGYKVALTTIALLAAAALNGVVAAKPSSGCGNSPKLAGNGTVEHLITVGGKSRKFYLKTPATYDNNHPYRFIFTLHALGGSANQVATGTGGYNAWYGLPPLVNDTTDAIYVAPDGLDRGWANQNDGDVTFLSEVIKQVEADLCIDQNLRFSTGFSYGGAMSYALACSLGSEIRAIAVLSGNPQISGCAGGTQPVAYYGQHGVSDSVLPIDGGMQMRDRFVKNNGCTPQDTPAPARGSGKHMQTTFSGCSAGYPVVWVAFDGDHTPAPVENGSTVPYTPGETWNFFSQFK